MITQAVQLIDEQQTLPIVREPADGQTRPMMVRSYGLTDIGKKRRQNEDQFLIAELTKALRVRQSSLPQPRTQYSDERGYLFIVADGMGGHQAGEQASALAVGTIEEFFLNTLKWFFHLRSEEEENVLAEFQMALRQADAKMFEEASRHPELRGMGTTLTMAYSSDSHLFVVHVGDSRCYLQRNGRIYRLTHDHTLVEEMLRHRALTPEQAAGHYLRHVITNCVGGDKRGLHVEVHRVELTPGDIVLLCSDGLTEMLSDERINGILRAEPDPERACRRLVADANALGGKDNITVIVSRFDAPSS